MVFSATPRHVKKTNYLRAIRPRTMTINLLDLLSQFRKANDRENENAHFLTQAPWVAPLAYLNVIFKPAPKEVLNSAVLRMAIPPVFSEFLAVQNGAILFSGALSVYGAVRPGQLLNRSEPFSLPPFSLDDHNPMQYVPEADRFLAIGGYGYDGSRVCVYRRGLSIHLFPRGKTELQRTASFIWMNLSEWLTSEVSRLSTLFDSDGHRLADEIETLPQFGSRGPS
jgi:hypothetical protein